MDPANLRQKINRKSELINKHERTAAECEDGTEPGRIAAKYHRNLARHFREQRERLEEQFRQHAGQ